MTLQEWSDMTDATDRAIAEALREALGGGESVSVQSVQKYRNNERIPTPNRMRAIHEITGGWVSANDFYNLADLTA